MMKRFRGRFLSLGLVLAAGLSLLGCSARKARSEKAVSRTPPAPASPAAPAGPSKLDEARSHFESGRYEEVVAVLQLSTGEPGTREDMLDFLFRAHLKLGRLDDAGRVLETWQGRFPESPALREAVGRYAFAVGQDELDKGLHESAAKQFRVALDVLPGSPDRWGESRPVEEVPSGGGVRTGPVLAAGSPGIVQKLLETLAGSVYRYLENGSPQKALKTVEMGRELLPASSELQHLRADVMRSMGDLQGALRIYRELLASRPVDRTLRMRIEELEQTLRTGLSTGTEATPDQLMEARRALAMGDLPQAEALARRLHRVDPRSPPIVILLTRVLRRTGKLDEARQILEAASSPGEPVPSLQLELASILSLQGNHRQALELLRRLLQRPEIEDPIRVEALVQLGLTLLASRQVETAEKVFQKVRELDPEQAAADFYLGRIQEDRKNLGQAIACYERASLVSRADPRRPEYLFRLALAYQQGGRREESRVLLERLLREEAYSSQGRKAQQMVEGTTHEDPGQVITAEQIETALDRGHAESAESAVRELMRGGSPVQRLSAQTQLGRILLMKRDFPAAATTFQSVLSQQPDDAGALVGLGESLYCQGLWAEAAESLRRAPAEGAPGAELRYWLGRCYEEVDLLDGALLAYEQTVHLAPDSAAGQAAQDKLLGVERGLAVEPVVPAASGVPDFADSAEAHPDSLIERARQLADEGQVDGALDLYRRARSMAPEDLDLSDEYAGLLERTGDLGSAIAELERSLQADPGDEARNLRLARLYYASKDPARSRERLRHVLALNPHNTEACFGLADLLHADGAYTEERALLEGLRSLDLSEGVNRQVDLLLRRTREP